MGWAPMGWARACNFSKRLNGRPAPYLKRPTMLDAAEIAAQAIALVQRRLQRRDSDDAHQLCRLCERVDLAPVALGTSVAAVKRVVRHFDLLRPGIRRGTIATVATPRRLLCAVAAQRGAGVRVVTDDAAGLLRARAEEQLAQSLNRCAFRRKLLREHRQRVDCHLQRRVVRLAERSALGALDDPGKLPDRHLVPLRRATLLFEASLSTHSRTMIL